MTIKEVLQRRDRFQPAPSVTPSAEELPLLEKLALVDELLRCMPIRHIEYYETTTPGGKVSMVTRGWPQLCAIFDFLDGKFLPWTDEARWRWLQIHRSRGH